MSLARFGKKLGTLATAAAIGAAALTAAGDAHAQAAEADSVSGRGKGIAGGALLGGEIVMITMAAFGVESAWPYFVFGGLGAVAGGVGGFFVEEATNAGTKTSDEIAEVPLYMLAGGMALVIPTLVATLNATAYKPPEGDQQEPTTNQPASEPTPPAKAGVKVTSDAKPVKRLPLSLVDVYRGDLALGVPAVEVRPVYSRREVAVYGVEQQTQVRVPVFKATF